MRQRILWLAILVVTSTGLAKADELPYGYPQSQRSKQCINTGWKFKLGDPDADYFDPKTNDQDWVNVSVPHTLELTSLTLNFCDDDKTQPTFQRNVGWYRRSINASKGNKKVFLEFEGAHQITDCWINGKHVGRFAVTGYSPFHFDISKYVMRGQSNQLTLRVDNRRNDSIPPDPGPFDYVKFSGLYRDVYLTETDPVHITYNWEALKAGIYITTPSVDPINKNATIDIKTVVRNESGKDQNVKVINRVIDDRGLVVLKLEQEERIEAGRDLEFNQIGSMEDDVHLWEIDHPYLYRVNTEVLIDGKSIDCLENKMGIRSFYLDNEKGFVLNGKPVKLIGMNRHQHYAYIGDALPNSLHYKDMLQFKQLGFNVVRTAHYPQDNALLDACDELGILVYEEAPTWINMSRNPQWWNNLEQAARIMVRNHRNHPSVVIWGAGINHRGYVARIHNAIKQEDPIRLTSSQGARWTGWQTSGVTDIYANMLYGPFIWNRAEPILAMEGWGGAEHIGSYKKDPKMTGIISWTAHAYHTFHPTHPKYQNKRDRTRGGYMTIFRQLKRGIQWYPSELRPEPYLFIENDWKASTKKLRVYSNADEVELFVNGKPFMKQKPSTDSIYEGLDHPPFIFEIENYIAGELKAVGYKKGNQWVSQSTRTPGKAYQLKLIVDTLDRKLEADGSDILIAYARVLDKNGIWVRDSIGQVRFTVSGPATIVGDGANINANPMFIETGEAPVLIKAGRKPGKIKLTAYSIGLKSTSVAFNSVEKQNDMVLANAKPIYDFKKIRVDLGAPDQLVQFGWKEWSSTNEKSSSYDLTDFGKASLRISTTSDDGVLRWLGEMNVIGKYGFAYGEGVIGMDDKGISLVFDRLPKGTYRIKTYHHAPRANSDVMDPNKEKLKSLSIYKLPYAKKLIVSVNKQEVQRITVSEGKEMQYDPVAKSVVVFKSDGIHPVRINFKDAKGNKGVWINAFEFGEWNANLQ